MINDFMKVITDNKQIIENNEYMEIFTNNKLVLEDYIYENSFDNKILMKLNELKENFNEVINDDNMNKNTIKNASPTISNT